MVLAIYAMAMAVVEAAVVVYLRKLYYPAGFDISSVADLTALPWPILKIELWREAATIVMLMAVSFLAFADWRKKVAAFILTFAVWDLGYYLFLYFFLKWPPSFTTMDVYFLIPWPWVGPVWIPIVLFSVLAVASLRWFYKIGENGPQSSSPNQ
ncbi:MAG: hypothetical protein AAB650_03100 [Patescibacteria group bacterium]